MSSSKQPQKKDKGKAIQTAADYQLQIPTQNQSTPLSANFQLPIRHKPLITIITKWLGTEPFFCNQMSIHGFLISMNNVKITFLFGFTIGGQCSDVLLWYCALKQEKVGIFGPKLH